MVDVLTFPAGRRAKFVILVAAFVVVGALGPLSGEFEDAQKNETSSFLPGDKESVRALEAVKRFPGGETAAAVTVLERTDGSLTGADLARAKGLVESLTSDRPRDTLPSEGPIRSRDGRAALVVTPVRATSDSGNSQRFLDTVDEIRDRAHALARGGLGVQVTGGAGFGAAAVKVFTNINGTLLTVAGGLVLILLILIYRSPVFWMIPFFTVLFAETSARGIGSLLAEAGVTINGQSAVKGQTLLQAHFPAGANVPTTVVVPDRARAGAVRGALAADRRVAQAGPSVTGPPGVRFDVSLRADPYSTTAFDQIPGLRAVAKRAGGPGVLVGGPTAESYDYRQAASRDNKVIPRCCC